jgi:deoxyribonuclease-4
MLPNGRRLGAHLPLGNGMVKAAERAAEIGASTLQVFTDNPATWNRRAAQPGELPAFRDRLVALDVAPLVVHAPYLVNLAGPSGDLQDRSIDLLVRELQVAQAWGARYLNVHAGSHRGDGNAAGIAQLADGAATALARTAGEAPDVVLIVENGSGTGLGIGTTMDELAQIDAALATRGVDPARTGFCLDTAHLWGAGYAVDTPAGVDEVVDAFDAAVGLGRLRLVHVNDSRSELGSRSDRHEHVGAGRIGAAGLGRFATHPSLDDVVYLLETPGMDEGWDEVNVRRLCDAALGRPLPDLPPEAFRTKSAKGRCAPAPDDEVVR